MLKYILPLCVLLLICVGAKTGAASKPDNLVLMSLTETTQIDTQITADAATGGLKISTAWPTVIALTKQDISSRKIEDMVLDYSAKVKTKDLKGVAFLEMWVHFPDDSAYFARGRENTIKNTTDWTTLSTAFHLQKGQIPNAVTLNLVINGKGTVWIDQVNLVPKSHDVYHQRAE